MNAHKSTRLHVISRTCVLLSLALSANIAAASDPNPKCWRYILAAPKLVVKGQEGDSTSRQLRLIGNGSTLLEVSHSQIESKGESEMASKIVVRKLDAASGEEIETVFEIEHQGYMAIDASGKQTVLTITKYNEGYKPVEFIYVNVELGTHTSLKMTDDVQFRVNITDRDKNPKYIVLSDKNSKYTLVNVRTGKRHPIDIDNPNQLKLTNDQGYIYGLTANGSLKFFNPETGAVVREVVFRHPEWNINEVVVNDIDRIFAFATRLGQPATNSNQMKWASFVMQVDARTGELRELKQTQGLSRVYSDGQLVVLQDLETGTLSVSSRDFSIVRQLEDSYGAVPSVIQYDKRFSILQTNNKKSWKLTGIYVYDAKTGALTKLPFDHEGSGMMIVGTNASSGDVFLIDQKNPVKQIWRFNPTTGEMAVMDLSLRAQTYQVSVRNNRLLYANMNQTYTVELKGWQPSSAVAEGEGKVFVPHEEPLTNKTFAATDVQRDLPSIVDFFDKKLWKDKPDWALAYILKMNSASPFLLDTLIKHQPELLSEEFLAAIAAVQPPRGIMAEYVSHVTGIVKEMMVEMPFASGQKLENWQKLQLFKPILAELPDDLRAEASNHIARTLANGAMADRQFAELLHAKMMKAAHQNVRKWFGDAYREYTDITYKRQRDGSFKLDLIAGEPIGSDTSMNAYGFYVKDLGVLKPNPAAKPGELALEQDYKWALGKEEYTAKMTAKPIDRSVDEFCPKLTTIDYSKMTAKKQLTGVIIVGSNLVHDTASIQAEYKSFYEGMGFSFKHDTKLIDVGEFLKSGIETGKLDYFVKEAHIDGDDRNIFRYVKNATLDVGTKKLPDGTVARVYLVMNHPGSEALLSNAEFGGSVRLREKAGLGQFVYVNSSCYACSKVANEIEAAHSPVLVVIGGQSTMNTFTDDEDSGIRVILKGIHEFLPNEKIREELAKTGNYKNGEDKFLLPDDSQYDSQVRQVIKLPLEVKIVLMRNGKEYLVDDAPIHK